MIDMRYLTVTWKAQTRHLCARHQVVESACLSACHRYVWLRAP